ncbi:hypothetical protein N0V90_006721 [Kalmusia sp. IMI 367209]|nr:hypothetical protein N0V90_006721 [Kalmusia sp. IMI 367209]
MKQTRHDIERHPTVPLDSIHSSDARTDVANTTQYSRPLTAEDSIRAQQSNLQRQQTQKKAEGRFYVDNDYYSLNPWKDRQDAPTLRIPPPDRFETEIDGWKYVVTRVEDSDGPEYEHGIGREDQARDKPSEHHTHQGLQSPTLMPDRMEDGFHNDHPPLQDTESVDTAQTAETQAEKQEIRHREEEAIQDYYNTYRNPLARLRARYPEAAAEFLSVHYDLSLLWFIYRDAITHIDPHLTPSVTGKAFYTIPQNYISVATAFFNDFLSAALYTCIAFAIGDDSNTPPGSGTTLLFKSSSYQLTPLQACLP